MSTIALIRIESRANLIQRIIPCQRRWRIINACPGRAYPYQSATLIATKFDLRSPGGQTST